MKMFNYIIVLVTLLPSVALKETLLATQNDSLKTYRQKRKFKTTSEPRGNVKKRTTKAPIFVIQKHAASHLHYDFRIQHNGVLKSWAVPKGIPTRSAIKHLAIPTEDHPLEYAQFEGTIPKSEYGAGTVKIWDHGTYQNIKEKNGKSVSMAQCLKNGTVEILLDGAKLHGRYALIRTKIGDGNKWLLFKMKEQRSKDKSQNTSIKIGKHSVTLTNQNKILFPKDKISKGDLIQHYTQIAEYMLPYMKNRAVTMHRFPDGITQEGFYQKDISDYFPSWIKTAVIAKQTGGNNTYVVCNDQATLVYLANQACITPHVWLSTINKLNNPDRMIFDLDPGTRQPFSTVKKAAQALRKILENLGLTSFVMTTGSRGLHVLVPLDRRADFDTVRGFAHDVATLVAQENPTLFTTEPRLNKRRGRLFIDTTRNAFAQTTVTPYAVRAKQGAPVATPLEWRELSNAKLTAQTYTIKNVFKRLQKIGDPWKDISRHRQSLSKARKKLKALQS